MTKIPRPNASPRVEDKRTTQGRNQNRNPGLFPQQTKKQIGRRGNELKAQAERAAKPAESYAADKRLYGRQRGADIPRQVQPRPVKPPLNTTQRSNKAANPGLYPKSPSRKGR